MSSNPTDLDASVAYLNSFICKTLRITTTDTRIFVGELKCTDRDQNLILSGTFEYKPPKLTAENIGRRLNMTSRFLGLVVVMGVDIIKIEVEEPTFGVAPASGVGTEGVGRGSWRIG